MIAPGTKLSHFEVAAQIGAGGMGEVYKARDTRLDRIVAIKVLPAHLADKPELRERFEREARTIASLNHPHICTLYDIGRQDGTDYLVMEYLEGETLATRLLKGPLPLEQVLQYAIEISDALDKAHRKGVTHRDIKPGNVMLTRSGTKLLDFGLAKLKESTAPADSVSQMPTLSHNPTAQGTLLGTIQYMAPEQVEGKNDEIDARTDIFAFGAILYEMATGKKAFEGKTNASIIGAILKDNPPPISSLQPMTPPTLDRVVTTCLAKDPDDRWQTARDIWRELKWIAGGGSQIAPSLPATVKGSKAPWRRAVPVGSGILLAALLAGFAAWNLKPTPPLPPTPVTRYAITLPQGQQLAGLDTGPAVAISPDGAHLAYVAREGATQQLYLRDMDSFEFKSVPGTVGAANPFFSPDSQFVGFFAGGKLAKVSVNGGAAQVLTATALARGASWSSQGLIAFAPSLSSGLEQVSDAGGNPQLLTRFDKGENSHRWPAFLPGGKSLLFAAAFTAANWSAAKVVVQSLDTGERRDLIQGGTNPKYAPSGHLVYGQGGTLKAVPFDLRQLKITGAAVPIVDAVRQSTFNGHAQYSFSNTGSLVYIAGGSQSGQGKLVWVSRNGSEQPLAAPERAYEFPRLSPDGRRVAASITDQDTQIWVYDLTREALTRLTFSGKTNTNSAWTPDGKRIAFNSDSDGVSNIYWQPADGSGGPERLARSNDTEVPRSWSPDGQLLTFLTTNDSSANKGLDIWVLRMNDRKAQPLIATAYNESVPEFSPDGHWLTYISDESGRVEVYAQPYPGPGGKWQISTEGGTEPVWNPNGRELFYRSGDKMMAVDIATQPAFAAGKPRVLFQGQYSLSPATMPNYDVSPDGQRFLMIKPTEQVETGPSQINVVLNWFEELKRRVPSGTK
jgi:Tol biopolymer transport system component/predicted Ser/Thr protein kinase